MLLTPNQSLLSLTLKQKLVLTLLIAVLSATPFWLGSERVHSASPESASSPAGAPIPEVKLVDVPAEALIGEQFKFKVTFDNTGNAVGYAPFIDVVLPAHGISGATPCDGISMPAGQNAMMVAVNGGPLPVKTYQSLTTPCGSAASLVTHPYSASGVTPVLVPAGGQLLTLELPFGSFEPDQPKIEVEITVDLHNFADVGQPLTIYARGGFRFGATALNEPSDPPILTNSGNPLTDGGNPSNSANWVERKDVIPTVFIVNKAYLGPENEAVSGPNFVSYYPLQYQVTVNIANGQKITNLNIDDCLENNMSFVGLVPGLTTAGATSSFTSPCLRLSYGAVTGTGSPADIIVTYEFYIMQFVDGTKTPVLDPEICSNTTSTNKAVASGDWVPLDPRDTPTTVSGSAKYTLTDKRLAIQKSVKVKVAGKKGQLLDKPGLPIPGDYLEYRLRFQVSDYFTFGELEINDMLSDGQLFTQASPAGPATFRVSDRFGTSQGQFGKSSLEVQEYFEENCQGVRGGTRLIFKVSQAMINLGGPGRLGQGIMTGGHAFTPTSSVPAEGEIVFYVRIQNEFSHQEDEKKKYVDKHDPMNNCVVISGRIYRNSDDKEPKPLENKDAVCSDDSATSLMIKPDVLQKAIIARNGKTLKPASKAPPKFAAGDTITFSISKTIPSGDWEDLKVQDWAPLPALDINSLNIPLTIPSCGGSFPLADQVCLNTPADNVGQPITTTKNPDNSFTFDYGTQNNPANTPKTIEIWYSLTLTNKPYADGLFFTNEVQECEFNTFGVKFCQVAVARFELTEPSLRITKGVVWAGSGEPIVKNSSAVFTPSPASPAGVIFSGPPSCPSFSGTIKSPASISSDVSNVDAFDTVLFAIVVENLGSGLNGAFDVHVKDTLPAGLTVVSPVCVTYGDGTPIPNNPTTLTNPALLFNPGPGVTLADASPTQGALAPLDATSAVNGHNIAVITFYAQVNKGIHPSCYTNKAELLNYASTEGGPSFVKPAGFGGPFSDTASVCVLPKADKCVTATSEPHTKPDNSLALAPPQPPKVAIGEIVRYRLQVKLPEGVSTGFTITDNLPSSMTYMKDNTTKVLFISDSGIASNVPAIANLDGLHTKEKARVNCLTPKPLAPLPASQITPGSFGPGVAPSFQLGTLTNSDNDNNAEYVILEFNALVNNLPPNVSALPNRDGVTLSNTFKVLIKGAPSPAATSNPADVKIVEPKLNVAKTASPASALPGAIVSFNVTVTNTGTADAFDVLITDPLPAASGLSLVTGSPSVTSACSTPVLNTSTGAVSVPRIGVGCSVTLTFKARVVANCPTKAVTNTAKADYSSLPLNGTPLGPNNLTGSVTPGASGAVNGERKYTASGSVTVPLLCTGSLTVTKVIKNATPWAPPAGTIFPVSVSCSPSGPNVTLNLTAGAPTQTVSNIPVGSTCTVTEGALPPPIAHPACASLGWDTPTYSPGQSVVIQTAGSNVTVQVQNTYLCKTGCATAPAGMVAWWPLDETGGSVVHSIVGNHDAVTQSGPIGAGGPWVASAPKVGSSLFFGAARAEAADDPTLDFGTGDFTIDVWVRSSQSTLLSAVVDKLDTSTPARRGYAFFVQNGKVQLVMADGNNTSTFQSSSTFVADGTWRHVAVTVRRVGGTPVGQFYIDGAPAGPSFTPLAGNIDSNATLLIANHRLSANACSCEVSLDEIELFKTAVAAGDIKAIFAAGSAGKCKATINGTKFDDLNGNGVRDGGEPGLANWTIKATDSGGHPQLTTTNSLGAYSLTVPAPGSYTVAEVLQTGWTQTAPATGTYAVAVAANQAINSRDFGNRKLAQCDLNIKKEVKPSPLVSGQPATVTITVKNVGTIPCHGPTQVTESLPAGMSLSSASVPGGSCVVATGVCTYAPAIPVNGTVVFTYNFKVTAQPGANFENCVRLLNPDNKNPTNDSACVPLTVGGINSMAKSVRGGSLPGLLLGAYN